ncbi:MAG: type II toxin-antitoxin system HicA family toxin [Bacteroidota bacterium]|jgi:predicted RNA binding protein YcfA (HicA-like mRNA interferase family)|nr:type II toxin-antitoxin system HicA family toxin [Bacteroidota bacterium]
MKYSEYERMLLKAGCYEVGEMGGHPLWYSPITGKCFKMSHHKTEEIKKGTFSALKKDSGVK